MSRKSRYVNEVNDSRTNITPWKAGIYIRLSREDADKKDNSSQSVISQRKIIDRFLTDHKDIEVFDYYIDDGYSGTNMDRPDFQRMKNAFENGVINCIIVKDLSRFARNDDESGRYIYVIFPFYKIRFISVNDRVDSFENPDSINNLEIPFKNIMHTEYSRDLSKKVRSASNIRRRRGEFLGAFCSYGYKKDPNDFHHLIIDDEAAEIVRFIFQRYIDLENYLQVAKELSAKDILTPLAYKVSRGQNLKVPNKQQNPTLWREHTIKRILGNQTYLGHLIQEKRQVISFKSKKMIYTDESKWVVVKNTHEPIIAQEIFDQVQALMEKNRKPHATRTYGTNIFAGKLFCGECGKSLSLGRSETTKFSYYYCNNAYLKKGFCSPKRIRNDKLENTVLATLNSQLQISINALKLLNIITNKKKLSIKKNTSTIEQKKEAIVKLQNIKSGLYEKYKDGAFTKEQYLFEKSEIENKIRELENGIEELSVEKNEEIDCIQPVLSDFAKSKKFKMLTREVIDKFIDKILVYSPTEIEIHFTFADELERINEYIKANTSQLASKVI